MVSTLQLKKSSVKSVVLKTTGHEKIMVTICLAAKADGTKLKLLIVFRGANRGTKPLDEEFKQCCIVMNSTNALSEELTVAWLKSFGNIFHVLP